MVRPYPMVSEARKFSGAVSAQAPSVPPPVGRTTSLEVGVLALSVARLLQSGSSSFAGHPLGNVLIMDRAMDRAELLARMLDATTPNETSTAIYEARRWLLYHPNDQEVWSAMAELIRVERQSLSPA